MSSRSKQNQKSTPQSLVEATNIGIIGYGIVGQAVAYGFKETSSGQDKIRYYDKYKKSLPLPQVINKSEFIFITLPTPMKKDESGIDLSIIDETVRRITPHTNNTDKIIIIKSTVVPGTTEAYEKKYPHSNFAFNPEFLTERNPFNDFLNAAETIIGSTSDLISRRIAMLYNQRFRKTKVIQTDPKTAEAIKYMRNSFLALKVAFANQWFDFCEKIEIKYEEVKAIAALDPRIVDAHLDVTTLRGFGGKCLPKDLVASIAEFKKIGVNASLLEQTWKYNKKIRKVYDWQEIPGAVEGNNKLYSKKATRR